MTANPAPKGAPFPPAKPKYFQDVLMTEKASLRRFDCPGCSSHDDVRWKTELDAFQCGRCRRAFKVLLQEVPFPLWTKTRAS